ncbi:hypothetical protein BaRGS_00013079 [Batillaria attramentaria]|uniref:JmjC domain-containing protein n=1 Tax=Batillaria attramentaria TaxID=370345 RepID=A0ABD0L848_9CAEN
MLPGSDSRLKTMLLSETCPPLLIRGGIDQWPASKWTVNSLVDVLKDKSLRCRLMPLERESAGKSTDNSPLKNFSPQQFSCYIDYKYMNQVFDSHPEMLKDVCWSSLGLQGIDGSKSTMWIGSPGACTPCHYDSYGFNLVAQIQGRKQWVLFPPEDSAFLYPTRIPYEESSVFSQVDVTRPDMTRFPLFKKSRPYSVTLEPGQVLYVPRHWWHFVTCKETAISINTWVDVPKDAESRVHEAVTRCLASALIPYLTETAGKSAFDQWINPTEEIEAAATNMAYLTQALRHLPSDEGPEKLSGSMQDVPGIELLQSAGGGISVHPTPDCDGSTSISAVQPASVSQCASAGKTEDQSHGGETCSRKRRRTSEVLSEREEVEETAVRKFNCKKALGAFPVSDEQLEELDEWCHVNHSHFTTTVATSHVLYSRTNPISADVNNSCSCSDLASPSDDKTAVHETTDDSTESSDLDLHERADASDRILQFALALNDFEIHFLGQSAPACDRMCAQHDVSKSNSDQRDTIHDATAKKKTKEISDNLKDPLSSESGQHSHLMSVVSTTKRCRGQVYVLKSCDFSEFVRGGQAPEIENNFSNVSVSVEEALLRSVLGPDMVRLITTKMQQQLKPSPS